MPHLKMTNVLMNLIYLFVSFLFARLFFYLRQWSFLKIKKARLNATKKKPNKQIALFLK